MRSVSAWTVALRTVPAGLERAVASCLLRTISTWLEWPVTLWSVALGAVAARLGGAITSRVLRTLSPRMGWSVTLGTISARAVTKRTVAARAVATYLLRTIPTRLERTICLGAITALLEWTVSTLLAALFSGTGLAAWCPILEWLVASGFVRAKTFAAWSRVGVAIFAVGLAGFDGNVWTIMLTICIRTRTITLAMRFGELDAVTWWARALFRLPTLLEFLLLLVGKNGCAGFARSFSRAPFARRNLLASDLLNVTKQTALFPITECNCDAVCAGARGPADAVNIRLGNVRQVEVDDVADAIDVDTTCGDICCDQHMGASGAEVIERVNTLALAFVAMDGGRVDAGGVKGANDLVGAVLGLGEHKNA